MWNRLIHFLLHLVGLSAVIMTDRIGNFSKAWRQFTEHPHLAHAVYSMTILDARTGAILFEHAKDIGLPPASSMKTITAAAALHYLGPDYAYETSLQYSGAIDKTTGFLDGYIYIVGSGDPSLGSWRFDETTTAEFVMKKWLDAIKQNGIKKCRGIIGDTSRWNNTQTMLIDAWAWNDLGNWYGTGHSALNWRENEFTIKAQPGPSLGAPARLDEIEHPPPRLQIINELTTSSSTEGEPSLYFSIDGSNIGYLRGVVSLDAPADFSIHCGVPNSALYAADELTQALRMHGIEVEQEATTGSSEKEKVIELNIHRSPPLSKLLEPFLRISINMYGEIFVKTIAHHTKLSSFRDAPLTILPLYVKKLFNINDSLPGMATTDGSGLSRSNRLTTYALAQILFQVQNEPWFSEKFYEAFPTINGLRMKSGTLLNTVAYAGYVRENSFIFSFMINNYEGEDAPSMRKKIWSVLDTLK